MAKKVKNRGITCRAHALLGLNSSHVEIFGADYEDEDNCIKCVTALETSISATLWSSDSLINVRTETLKAALLALVVINNGTRLILAFGMFVCQRRKNCVGNLNKQKWLLSCKLRTS